MKDYLFTVKQKKQNIPNKNRDSQNLNQTSMDLFSTLPTGKVYRYQSIYKDILDCSEIESQSNIKISDYMKTSKINGGKMNTNYSIQFEDKLDVISSPKLTNETEIVQFTNDSSIHKENGKIKIKNKKLINTNSIKKMKKDSNSGSEEKTKKIEYKYISVYPIKNVDLKRQKIEENDNNNLYWLATYDKLMKNKKILKILKFYGHDRGKKGEDFIEKSLTIDDFELYFTKNSEKPFIRSLNGGKIFVKLYLLTLEEINMIFSYINRIEYDSYIKKYDFIPEKGTYQTINGNKNNFFYSVIYCLGSFINRSILSFSKFPKDEYFPNESINNINFDILPTPRKIAKLIKLLILNFPDYSKEYFITYLFSSNKPNIKNDFYNYCANCKSNNTRIKLIEKMNTVNNLLLSEKKIFIKSIKQLNPVITKAIKDIPLNSPSFEGSSNSQYNNSSLFQNISNSQRSSDGKNQLKEKENSQQKSSETQMNSPSNKNFNAKKNCKTPIQNINLDIVYNSSTIISEKFKLFKQKDFKDKIINSSGKAQNIKTKVFPKKGILDFSIENKLGNSRLINENKGKENIKIKKKNLSKNTIIKRANLRYDTYNNKRISKDRNQLKIKVELSRNSLFLEKKESQESILNNDNFLTSRMNTMIESKDYLVKKVNTSIKCSKRKNYSTKAENLIKSINFNGLSSGKCKENFDKDKKFLSHRAKPTNENFFDLCSHKKNVSTISFIKNKKLKGQGRLNSPCYKKILNFY